MSNQQRRTFFQGLLGFGGLAAAAPASAQAAPSTGPALPGGLSQIFWARSGKRRRESSWDRKGKNSDRIPVAPGQTAVIADARGAGCIRHIWITVATQEPEYLRRLVLRAYWDGESSPSVETPIGDFFGVGHARATNYWSLPLNMVTGAGASAKTTLG